MNKRERIIKLCNMFCALALAVLLVLQFMPFWYSVGGVHKTKDEYLDWSATYIPVAERPTESKAPATTAAATETTTEATTVTTEATAAPTETTAATEETTAATGETTGATEETTGATEETTAVTEGTEPTTTEATTGTTEETTAATGETEPAATEAKKDSSGRTERPSKRKDKNTAPKDPFSYKDERAQQNDQSQAVKPTTPYSAPTDPEIKTMSIASSVWRYNTYKEGYESPLLLFHIAILAFGALGVFFCLTKSKKSINCIWVMATAVLGTIGYFTNAGAQTGMAWMLHGGVSAFLLIPGTALLVFWIKDLINWFTKVEE